MKSGADWPLRHGYPYITKESHMETKTLVVNGIPRRLLVNPDDALADVSADTEDNARDAED